MSPEILISVFSVFDNTPDLAIGNALGSNIANIGLILGVTALIIPIGFASKLLLREFPILLLASALMTWVLWDTQLDLIDGILLLVTLVIALLYLVRVSRREVNDELARELEQEIPHNIPLKHALMWTLVGLLILIGSAAGLSAIFRSPIGTAFFVIEVLYSTMEFDASALLYTMLASAVAYAVNGLFVGWRPLFYLPDLTHPQFFDYPWYIVLGIASGLIATLLPVLILPTIVGGAATRGRPVRSASSS